jgi:hypothetical protein
MMTTYDIEPQIEEQYDNTQEENLREMGTYAAEPAVEQEPEQRPYDGWEGCWEGDGSGMNDLADMMANEGGDW